MAAVRLVAEGVGPFEKLDLDLSDGHGNPHLGPHILAGVNGSGKSTALRTIGWALASNGSGFPFETWQHRLTGHAVSRAFLLMKEPGGMRYGYGCVRADAVDWSREFLAWVRSWCADNFLMKEATGISLSSQFPPPLGSKLWWARFPLMEDQPGSGMLTFAAYSPSRALEYIEKPDLDRALQTPDRNALAFESTVDNDSVQLWLSGLFSKTGIRKQRDESTKSLEKTLTSLQSALHSIYRERITLDVDLDHVIPLPKVVMRGRGWNFSQLPDGVRTILGWLADFLMRRDMNRRRYGGDVRQEILLIDEIDAHLHPRWQRQVLPALRETLPGVQIIVTSHSPFVISSCPNARVHVLEVDDQGKAHARPPVDAPFGQSVIATLKDILDVESRFDVQTEKELGAWNELKRQEAVGRLSPSDKKRLQQLTDVLSDRSEELRWIVGMPVKLSSSMLGLLDRKATAKKHHKTPQAPVR